MCFLAKNGPVDQLRAQLTSENVNEPSWDGELPICCAVRGGDIECVKVCIEKGANLNMLERRFYGQIFGPLHVAICNGEVEMVHLLLQCGADPNLMCFPTDYMPSRPLENASINNKSGEEKVSAITKLLIDYGANICVIANPTLVVYKELRTRCRNTSILVMGILLNKPKVMGGLDVYIFKLIGQHVWSMRFEKEINFP